MRKQSRSNHLNLRSRRAVFSPSSFAGLLVFGSSILTSCGPKSPTDATDDSNLNIVGGYVVSAGDITAARTATVALTNQDLFAKGKSFCTSTLIRPDVLLTAAHCVTDQDGKVSGDGDQPMLAVFELEVGKDVSLARRVRAIAVHKFYDSHIVGAKDPSVYASNDVALLALEGTAPSPYKPVDVVAETSLFKQRQEVLLAGYGVTATRTVNTTGKLRAVKATIHDDHNSGNVLLLRGPQLNARAIDYDESGKTKIVQANGGACAGDSGGPAFAKASDGSYKLVGATSYGSELRLAGRWDFTRYCVGENGYVDLRKYARGIASAAKGLTSTTSVTEKLQVFRFTNHETVAAVN